MQYLYLAQLLFTVWLLLDVYRRQEAPSWYAVILLLPVLGAWYYFFRVKIHDFGGWAAAAPPSLEELRLEAEQTPTLERDLAVAEALIDRSRHGEAIPYLESARRREPDHCQVLYWLALCRTEQGHPDEALPLLDRILEREPRWSDYAAWRLLIAARAQHGDGLGALAACRELVRLAPTLQYHCLLAERLLVENMAGEAHAVLAQALESYRYSPPPIRRRHRRWFREARRLQRQARKFSDASR
ncbi:MAG: tetratricopeptide repeat protein [Planctomycetia bacterium]|nr:tetratricopeptide repeat protein [Planctomycetia bacterium]